MDKNTKKVMFSSKSDEYGTPQDFYDKLHREFGFTLDPAATDTNHKCQNYYTQNDDGLNKSWKTYGAVFCNPPYSKVDKWIEKGYNESLANPEQPIVFLVPARTETRYWQKTVFPNAECICFIRGRLKFGNEKNAAPFPSAICIFSGRKLRPNELLVLKEMGRVVYEKRGNNE